MVVLHGWSAPSNYVYMGNVFYSAERSNREYKLQSKHSTHESRTSTIHRVGHPSISFFEKFTDYSFFYILQSNYEFVLRLIFARIYFAISTTLPESQLWKIDPYLSLSYLRSYSNLETLWASKCVKCKFKTVKLGKLTRVSLPYRISSLLRSVFI